jgi:prepilin peptidase CpaA
VWLTSLWDTDQMAFVQWSAVICASLAGACFDLRTRRIPNWLSALVLLTAIVFALLAAGPMGLVDGMAGMLLMGLPFVALYIFAGGGAGDAKLMGAMGAWLGMLNAALVLTCVALSGGRAGSGGCTLSTEVAAGAGGSGHYSAGAGA